MSNYTTEKVLRVACYERVSTDEQAKHGISIDAQISSLGRWVKDHGHIMIGHFTDAGVSGGKAIEKRPAMLQLLRAVEDGQVDLIVFTKLDRWFRSLKNYYIAQDVLDKAGCAWRAIDEDYETLSSAGRFKVNIMLSVAQQERERTGERIQSVFDYRAARGEFLTGGRAIPCGYQLKDKHLEKDPETAPMIDRLFRLALSGMTMSAAIRAVKSEYPQSPTFGHCRRILYNPVYAGMHDSRPGYCPAYITPDQHAILIGQKGTRAPKDQNRVYLFVGLLVCPECGRKLRSTRTTVHGTDYTYYVCSHAQLEKDCRYKTFLSESRVERALTDKIFSGEMFTDRIKAVSAAQKSGPTPKEIEAKMKRLAETYTDGLIDRDAYKRRLADLTDQLEAAKKAPEDHSTPPMELVQMISQGNLRDVYDRLSKRERRRFWVSCLQSFAMDAEYNFMSLIFYDRFST